MSKICVSRTHIMCRPGVELFCAQEQSQITPIIRSIPVQYETRTNETGRERELKEEGVVLEAGESV